MKIDPCHYKVEIFLITCVCLVAVVQSASVRRPVLMTTQPRSLIRPGPDDQSLVNSVQLTDTDHKTFLGPLLDILRHRRGKRSSAHRRPASWHRRHAHPHRHTSRHRHAHSRLLQSPAYARAERIQIPDLMTQRITQLWTNGRNNRMSVQTWTGDSVRD
ncbi:uncharacterized protein LOC101864501 [Aplysia californica]|uniref:Uncharacterized protein LOC101864501 n=1 Tax=Aplysia californica TaxID=6500 RepID=A0ABM0KA20_APLCA|nr:uncharacterized protein LOC101864501 [Aplysia californica]